MPQYAVRRFNAALTEVLSHEPEPLDEFAMLSWIQVQQAQADEGDRLDIHTLPDAGAEMPGGWPESPIVPGGAGTVLVGEPAPGVALAASTILFGDGVDVLVEDGVASVSVPASGGGGGTSPVKAATHVFTASQVLSLATHGTVVGRQTSGAGTVNFTLPDFTAGDVGKGFDFTVLHASTFDKTFNIQAPAGTYLWQATGAISAGPATTSIGTNPSPGYRVRAWIDTGNLLGNGADAKYWIVLRG